MASRAADTTTSFSTSITLDADLDSVWRALTTDDGLAAWFGEGSTLDPRPEGAFAAPDIATARHRTGVVRRCDPGRRLELEWWPTDEPRDVSVVAFELSSHDDQTVATVTETRSNDSTPPCAGSSDAPRAMASASVTSGSWAWRLAALSLACSLVATCTTVGR